MHQLLIDDANARQAVPNQAGQRVRWTGLHGSGKYLALTEALAQHTDLVLVVTADSTQADAWADALEYFMSDGTQQRVMRFPDWETLPYDNFSPHQDIISQRLSTLNALRDSTARVLCVPIGTLLQRIPPPEFLAGACFNLNRGQRFSVQEQRLLLDAAGYNATDMVVERGQYAVRGALMDIFPMGADSPVRIDLFDDEIDTLRTFDPDTQRTLENIASLQLLPAKEFPFDDAAIARFRERWHNTFNVDVRRCSIYQDVSSYIAPNGIEYYLPFFFDQLANLFDYLPDNLLTVVEDGVDEAAQHFLEEVANRYESLRYDIEKPILPPAELFLGYAEFRQGLLAAPRIELLEQQDKDVKHEVRLASKPLPDLHANARLATPTQALQNFIETCEKPILFVAETAGRREVFDEMLGKAGIVTHPVAHFSEYVKEPRHSIMVAPLQQGLWLDEAIIITEDDVLGSRPTDPKRDAGRRVIDADQIVRNLTELSIGAPVVHVEHGVGRFMGLQTLQIDADDHEFLTLEYAGNAKLYVPVTALHLISRYAGADQEHAPLHRLGSDQWERAKKKAAEKVVDVAAELLDIYARRASKKSAQMRSDGEGYELFAQEFPFAVTLDQQTAIEQTLADMAAEQAMDRLVCGDVGFGKTEVAMRAAFVAVQSGKQVVVLVPTTLLAQQHFDSFQDRFANWPVRIETVSRLRSQSEIDTIIADSRDRKVDILIGTHKLLNSQFKFKDLGLIVIDEEHRFGVRQKERLRSLRAEVDVLTLTATPIPRTLNMSLNGIRDLSIIATPPAKRLSIKTFVQPKRSQNLREAITRELIRGGQVFYLHNEVRTIEQTAEALGELIPEARVGIGHGQMRKGELEEVMSDFYHRRLNTLVCTTIIETGIDIPNANTIIIERADKFGLAQLHQLRGRVGRSSRQAYAYLLTPEGGAMTADAVKRLDAIEAAGELGVGFTLATHDMEIRGAGELLGDDQSGQIESIGFSLYMEMLHRAVAAIQSGQLPDVDSPLEPVNQEVNLHIATLIPEDYLPDVHTRLILYKRISAAASETELNELQVEIIDRFGLLPLSLKNLFKVTELKLTAQTLGILKVDVGPAKGKLEFSQNTNVEPIEIVKLVQQKSHIFSLDGAATLRFTETLESFEERLDFAQQLLASLSPRESAAA